MRLSDIMGHMRLTTYPEIGLVMFLGIFAAVVVYVLRGSREKWTQAANLPLKDEARHG